MPFSSVPIGQTSTLREKGRAGIAWKSGKRGFWPLVSRVHSKDRLNDDPMPPAISHSTWNIVINVAEQISNHATSVMIYKGVSKFAMRRNNAISVMMQTLLDTARITGDLWTEPRTSAQFAWDKFGAIWIMSACGHWMMEKHTDLDSRPSMATYIIYSTSKSI